MLNTLATYVNQPQIAEAEAYIEAIISLPLDDYKRKVINGETNKTLHYYFGMSQNAELKEARSGFKKDLGVKVEQEDTRLWSLMQANINLAKRQPDVFDAPVYMICFAKGSYMVIGIQKPSNFPGKQCGRGHQLNFSSKEAPKFYEWCKKNLQSGTR